MIIETTSRGFAAFYDQFREKLEEDSVSWTITEDNGVLHVRAALDRAEETLTLIERLRERYATFEFKEGGKKEIPDEHA